MDELITKHSTIMDKYDPEKRVGLIVDEWGSWLAVEPGTNPGFLYQQNTIRDAMLASLTLNIFHKHSDRVHMANIAQMVNVLQSMILTDGEKMIKTPTYHVFNLYKNHMDATKIDSWGDTKETTSYTATKKDGVMTLSFCNYAIDESDEVTLDLGFNIQDVHAEVLVGETMDAHSTFEEPERVNVEVFSGYEIAGEFLKITLPPKSVVSIYVKAEK